MESIRIDIRTMNWSYGYYYSCHIRSPKGCRFVIEWGDGKVDYHTGTNEWQHCSHSFPEANYRQKVHYYIHIFSDEQGGLLGFQSDGGEVETENIDVSGCPSLQQLNYWGLPTLDVTRNPELKELDCRECEFTTLDLSHNVNLEILSCCCCRQLKRLDLSRNLKLKELDCSFCNSLSQLGLNNFSSLQEVTYNDTRITGKIEEHLLRILKQNGGKVNHLWEDFDYE